MPAATLVNPVHCPSCDIVFLPPGNNPDQIVQCPGCSMQSVLAACRPAAKPKLEVADRWSTEAEDKAKQRSTVRKKQSKLMIAAGLGVVTLSAVLAARYWPQFNDSKAVGASEAKSAAQAEEEAAIAEATAAAKSALEAPDWQSLLLSVRNPDRIRPLMEWYYRHRDGGHVPYQIAKCSAATFTAEAPATAVLRLETAEKKPLHVVMERTAEGWKLDWESFTNVHGIRWRLFLSGEGGLPESLAIPVHVQRLPVSLLTNSFHASIGSDPASTKDAARIFVADPTREYAAAVFPADSSLAAELLAGDDPDAVKKFTLEVARRGTDPMQYPPCVEVRRILRRGWDVPPVEARAGK